MSPVPTLYITARDVHAFGHSAEGYRHHALDYLRPRLFDPLGIHGATWESCPQGINTGGWGLKLKTEDIAKFGQLYLQKGVWEGQRLIPEAWIEEATSKQISNGPADSSSDWTEGYGYQFWMCRHGAYRGDGAFGQFCVVGAGCGHSDYLRPWGHAGRVR